MVQRHPREAVRVHPIGALAGEGPLFVFDPYGGGGADCERAYARIEAILRRVPVT